MNFSFFVLQKHVRSEVGHPEMVGWFWTIFYKKFRLKLKVYLLLSSSHFLNYTKSQKIGFLPWQGRYKFSIYSISHRNSWQKLITRFLKTTSGIIFSLQTTNSFHHFHDLSCSSLSFHQFFDLTSTDALLQLSLKECERLILTIGPLRKLQFKFFFKTSVQFY